MKSNIHFQQGAPSETVHLQPLDLNKRFDLADQFNFSDKV